MCVAQGVGLASLCRVFGMCALVPPALEGWSVCVRWKMRGTRFARRLRSKGAWYRYVCAWHGWNQKVLDEIFNLKKKYLVHIKGCRALSGDVTNKTKKHNEKNKQDTTKSERKRDSKTEAQQKHPRQPQQYEHEHSQVLPTSSVVGLVLFYPVCRPRPAFVNRGFPMTATPPPSHSSCEDFCTS